MNGIYIEDCEYQRSQGNRIMIPIEKEIKSINCGDFFTILKDSDNIIYLITDQLNMFQVDLGK
jgi:hypothetical protein